ncbi:transposase [Methylomagnum ishizawai]|uniref:transposase n=1 Tax=Methylomagnum ishizawai TaxID=1760988 RepID=UPI0034CFE55C
MPKQGISIREAARRLGVDEKTLRNWRVQGFLALLDDGSIDPARLDEGTTRAGRAQSPIHGGKRAKGRAGNNHLSYRNPRFRPNSFFTRAGRAGSGCCTSCTCCTWLEVSGAGKERSPPPIHVQVRPGSRLNRRDAALFVWCAVE